MVWLERARRQETANACAADHRPPWPGPGWVTPPLCPVCRVYDMALPTLGWLLVGSS